MWRQLGSRGAVFGRAVALRGAPRVVCPSRAYFQPPFFSSPEPLRSLQRAVREMQQEFDRVFGNTSSWYPSAWFGEFAPGGARDHPTRVEAYRMRNPIVEEDGVKKLLLEFDVRRFKPDQVNVTTNAKENTLVIEAKHKDDSSKFEFSRKLTLPEGVVVDEMTCRFTADGILQIKAPYKPPPEPEPKADTEIKVKHE